MLVLSRKTGEKIIIGDGIELMVVGVCGNRVKLGIAAPDHCRIVRAERRDVEPTLHVAEPMETRETLATCGT